MAIASINAFHIVGGLFALWAVTVTFLGLSREGLVSVKNSLATSHW